MSDYLPVIFGFCFQCEQIVKETIDNVRWFEKSFCNVSCLNKYHRIKVIECRECNAKLLSGRVFALKSLSDEIFFCSSKCRDAQKNSQQYCSFCFVRCKNKTSVGKNASLQKDSKVFCSVKCWKTLTNVVRPDKKKIEECASCNFFKMVKVNILLDGVELGVCSTECYRAFQDDKNVKFERCHQCMIHFKNEANIAYIIMEKSSDKIFCSKSCMNFHLVHDRNMVNCVVCDYKGRFYDMIRSSYKFKNRAWCSLDCALLYRKQLIIEDEHGGQNIFQVGNVDLGIEQGLNEAQMALPRLPGKEIVENLPIIENAQDGKEKEWDLSNTSGASLTKYTIKPKTKEEVAEALNERKASFAQKCSNCFSPINKSNSFLRWITMEFCDVTCFKDYLKAQHEKCSTCKKVVSPRNMGAHLERIGNEICHFCSAACKDDYFHRNKHCAYCQQSMPDDMANTTNRLCSDDCAQEYENLWAVDKKRYDGVCTECNKLKPMQLTLFYEHKSYHFCSFACFFFLKFLCGIYADQCIICTNYFVRDPDEAFTIRHDHIVNILCSPTCLTHYIVKYRSVEMCCFCTQEKYNFSMLKMMEGFREKKFCSVQCLDLLDECKEAEAISTAEPKTNDHVNFDAGLLSLSDNEELKNIKQHGLINGAKSKDVKRATAPLATENACIRVDSMTDGINTPVDDIDHNRQQSNLMNQLNSKISRNEQVRKRLLFDDEKENADDSVKSIQSIEMPMSAKTMNAFKLDPNFTVYKRRLKEVDTDQQIQLNDGLTKKVKTPTNDSAQMKRQ